MASLLKNMQDTVAKYANVLSQILKVDVEIVDENLDRIAGTGMFAGRINKNIEHEGYVYKEVIKTGKRKIIKEPGRHKICTNCPKLLKQGYCEETFEMSMPISTGEKVIGVIGFVCFNNEQKEHILHNFDTFAEFLEQISDLISTKAKEEIEKENMLMIIDMLNHIIDKMDQGVIIADEEGKVSSLNSIAKKFWKLTQIKIFI